MYWSPIRTRLLVGMFTPSILANAGTPLADWATDLPVGRTAVCSRAWAVAWKFAAAAGLRAPARAAIPRLAGVRALWLCDAWRAAAVRGAAGGRRADIAPPLSWSKTAAA